MGDMGMHAKAWAAIAAAFVLGWSAVAQDDATELGAPNTSNEFWTDGADGVVVHTESNVACPAAMGDAARVEVLSYDRQSGHVGLSCHYRNVVGSEYDLFIWRAGVTELTGDGDQNDAWNSATTRLRQRHPRALPMTPEGLGDAPAHELYGIVFRTGALRGVPVNQGIWLTQNDAWVVRGIGVFLNYEGGLAGATALRQAVIDARAVIDG